MTAWLDLLGHLVLRVDDVDAGGVRTRALRAGDGPDVVFLHGTSGHLEAFTRNVAAHVEAGYPLPRHRHARPRLHRQAVDFPYEIPRYVEHLAGYLDGVRHRARQPGRRVTRRLGRRWLAIGAPGAGDHACNCSPPAGRRPTRR